MAAVEARSRRPSGQAARTTCVSSATARSAWSSAGPPTSPWWRASGCRSSRPRRRERYADVFSRYLARLEQGGLHVVPSRLVFLDPGPDGRQVGYVVQPVLPSASLGPDILRAAEPDPEHPLLTAVVAAVLGAVDERTGLDAQISNWAVADGARSTWTSPPRSSTRRRARARRRHADRLLPVAAAAAPAPFRRPADRCGLLRPAHGAARPGRQPAQGAPGGVDPRRAGGGQPGAGPQPITSAEVDRYYRSNARLWEVMLRLRQADRWWQRRIRRRAYPFLLPDPTRR